jgi:hypothetical protein
MKTDREREAGQLRAEGDEEKARITATADREVAVIKADAGLKAQIVKGEADGEATRIYAQAFSKDKDFYAFYRRMEAYKQAFGAGGSTMILSPDTTSSAFQRPAGPPAAKIAPGPPAKPPGVLWQSCNAAGCIERKAESCNNRQQHGLFICATIGGSCRQTRTRGAGRSDRWA